MPQGGLFSQYFLTEGVTASSGWPLVADAGLAEARAEIAALLADFTGRHEPQEAETERDLIDKLLVRLGWSDFLVQIKATAKGRSDVPDYLLFTDPAAKQVATALPPAQRYAHGASIVEAKAWDLSLDKSGNEIGEGAPSTQILRYLGAVDVRSEGAIRFGILTNGRVWRLYDNKARSRLEGFVEIDLFEAAGLIVPAERPTEGEAGQAYADHVLRLFLWMFGRDAFVADAGGATRLTQAISDSRSFEARVTDHLAETVFDTVFPDLANALWRADPDGPADPGLAYRAELREAALTWLYRLLFVLYAEDRSLLPTRNRRDGLWATRKAVAEAIDRATGLSERRTNYDGDLRDLWRQIDIGDKGIGLPPYNGSLFKTGRSKLLDRTVMPDSAFAPLLDALSRERIGEGPRLINYRDLNVQHLGSVYERLLEYEVVERGGRIVTRPQTFARKTSGSYYTPEELVMLVIRRTIGPLLDERRKAFADAVADRDRANQVAAYRNPWLGQFDPASAFLSLRICDPAMGSGHFLVSLVDYLADQAMLATREASELVEDYRSPLLDRLEDIRARILAQAETHGWAINPAQLVDRQLVRRIILKRVIHGIDKNPMAVELAKLSLWLHTFTVGAPLSFLDHHLRCGDSLFGEWVNSALDRLAGGGLYQSEAIAAAELSVPEMEAIEALTDASIAEVHASADAFADVEEKTRPLSKLMSLLQGYRWVEASAEDALKQARKLRREADSLALKDPAASLRKSEEAAGFARRGTALDVLLREKPVDPVGAVDLCYGRIGDPDPALDQIAKAAEVAHVQNFLHWEIAFPGVWRNWRSRAPEGGFDAVIGNPPWDRLKMQEVEWFAARAPEIAHATRASDRKRMVRELNEAGDDLARQYARASEMAGFAGRMANLRVEKGGQFPLLGGGDTNLYSLFVERAARLVHANGIVGLLTPSGIAGDLSASEFFRSISTTGRLGALLDYANRPAPSAVEFFPDVDSRFKFCAIVFGGAARRFGAALCGFFLRETGDAALDEATFPLTPRDFAAVNPNTGTAPVFRTVRDADLTTAIYARLPVLVRHREGLGGRARDAGNYDFDAALAGGAAATDEKPWPVRYTTMFHMTNDSHLFRTRAELIADGWYAVEDGSIRKGERKAVPLYVGKMFNQYDHRAANVTVNETNLHNPANSDLTTADDKNNPMFQPEPQFWVDWKDVSPKRSWTLGFRDIARPTDARTIISAILPTAAYGNTAALLLLDDAVQAACLSGNLNAFALDYLARQKVQGTHANWYIVEQLPVIPPQGYDRRFDALTAREIVVREVLRLTYTAHDMAPFARDMGHVDEAGEPLAPFAWDEADRRQRRARLDALYFHLYGISREDADYILSTFPIVRRQDEAAFEGRFVTRDLILAQMAALEAGDTEAVIALR